MKKELKNRDFLYQLYAEYWKVYKTIISCTKSKQVPAANKMACNFVNKWYYYFGQYSLVVYFTERRRIDTMATELTHVIDEKKRKLAKKRKK